MRLFLSIILSLFYLVISVGFINSNTYCQGRLIKTSLIINNNVCDKCPYCAQNKCKKDGSCCNHSEKYMKFKVDQNYTSYNSDITPLQIILLDTFLSGYSISDSDIVSPKDYPATNAPPTGAQHPIHILNCTYLI